MNEQMGFSLNDRIVIINADDFGITHSTNQAVLDLFQNNSITSASIMIPCSKADEAALIYKQNNSLNVGIHLTLTSAENHVYKPTYQESTLNTLVTKEGFFPHNVSVVTSFALNTFT